MPAQSQQQQKLFGLALAFKRGEVKSSEVSDEIKGIADRMSEKEIEDFAATKRKGLPKMKEQLRKIVREIMREQSISEMNENENPCWNGYEMVGMKMKDGKEVPNCVPKNESVNEIQYDDALAKFNKELENNSEIKKAAKHYKKSVQDVVKVLQSKIKVNRYSDKSIKQISINYTEDGPLSSKVTIKASQNYKQNESVNEGKYDGMLDVIEDLVSKAKSFMDVGNQLKKHKVKYSFSTSMIPMYKLDKLPIVIVNKKYVDKADREVGDIAIGLMESINESLINESPSSEELRIVMMAVRKIAKYRNVPIDQSIVDVLNAAEQLERDIKKGKIKK